jgi:hypothetical protein
VDANVVESTLGRSLRSIFSTVGSGTLAANAFSGYRYWMRSSGTPESGTTSFFA